MAEESDGPATSVLLSRPKRSVLAVIKAWSGLAVRALGLASVESVVLIANLTFGVALAAIQRLPNRNGEDFSSLLSGSFHLAVCQFLW